MGVKLRNGAAASAKAILALKTHLGCGLSGAFEDFVRSHDGAKPETNVFKVSDTNECGVTQFIPVEEIWKERSHIENIPGKGYPVAWAESGNYVFVDEDKKGAVFFWDHETARVTEIAKDFAQFLNLLEPFDVTSIKLKPGQVKRVWVDPEFLARLKKP